MLIGLTKKDDHWVFHHTCRVCNSLVKNGSDYGGEIPYAGAVGFNTTGCNCPSMVALDGKSSYYNDLQNFIKTVLK